MQLYLLLFVWDWLRPDASMMVAVALLEGQYQFAGTAEIVFPTCWELSTLQSVFLNIASVCCQREGEPLTKCIPLRPSTKSQWLGFLLPGLLLRHTFLSAIICAAAVFCSPNRLSAHRIFFFLVPSSHCLGNNDKQQERVTCAAVPGQLLSQVWLSRTY